MAIFSIDLVGLGVAQTYSILADIVLLEARALLGSRSLRLTFTLRRAEGTCAKCSSASSSGHLKRQLFITTHSNLFDLDPTGYGDVSLVDGVTRVERRPLRDLDAHFLRAPGPPNTRSLSYFVTLRLKRSCSDARTAHQ